MNIKTLLFPVIVAYDKNKKISQKHEFYKPKELKLKWRHLIKIETGMYDSMINEMESHITEKVHNKINLQWIKELKDNKVPQETIDKIVSQINASTYDGLALKWSGLLSRSCATPNIIEKITNDLYTFHERGIITTERKAASLLVAVGFSVSLISILIGLSHKDTQIPTEILLLATFFFSVGIIHMTIAGISAWHAERVRERHLSTVKDLENTIHKPKFELDWAVLQLVNLELNNDLWAIKGHWLDVAQRHFIYGLISTVIGFFILVTDIMIVNIPKLNLPNIS